MRGKKKRKIGISDFCVYVFLLGKKRRFGVYRWA